MNLARLRRAASAFVAGIVAAASALTTAEVPVTKGLEFDEDYDRWLRTPIEVQGISSTPSAWATATQSGKTFVELPTRTVQTWTPDMVRGALAEADTGRMWRPAELVEAIMGDDRVQGVLSTRTHGLLGLPKQFFGKATQVKALEGKPAADGSTGVPGDFVAMFPENECAKLLAWGILLGVGVAELVPPDSREIGEREVPTLKIWHPKYLRWQWDLDQWFLMTSEGEIEINPGDGRWILFMPYGSHRPWTQGAWRPSAFAWVLKQFALHDRARHSEVLGSAARVGYAPQGAVQTSRKRYLADIRAMGRDNAIVLPEGWDLKMVEATGQTWQIYSAQVEWADRAIAITLAGQAVTTEGTTGFSNGNIHAAIKHDLIVFTAEAFSTCVREQGLKPWAAANFDDPKLAPWARWDTAPPEDKKTMAEAIGLVGDAITKLDAAIASSGQRVDSVSLVGKYGVPLIAREEEAAPAPIPLSAHRRPLALATQQRASNGQFGSGDGSSSHESPHADAHVEAREDAKDAAKDAKRLQQAADKAQAKADRHAANADAAEREAGAARAKADAASAAHDAAREHADAASEAAAEAHLDENATNDHVAAAEAAHDAAVENAERAQATHDAAEEHAQSKEGDAEEARELASSAQDDADEAHAEAAARREDAERSAAHAEILGGPHGEVDAKLAAKQKEAESALFGPSGTQSKLAAAVAERKAADEEVKREPLAGAGGELPGTPEHRAAFDRISKALDRQAAASRAEALATHADDRAAAAVDFWRDARKEAAGRAHPQKQRAA